MDGRPCQHVPQAGGEDGKRLRAEALVPPARPALHPQSRPSAVQALSCSAPSCPFMLTCSSMRLWTRRALEPERPGSSPAPALTVVQPHERSLTSLGLAVLPSVRG